VGNYLVATYDGSHVRFYLNGSLDATVAVTSSTLLNDSQTTGYAGADLSGSSYAHLTGRLAKVAVYGTVLTGTQISNHFAAATHVANTGFLAFM
jgi:Concanavalin A-like lectin/glucanases superfamily